MIFGIAHSEWDTTKTPSHNGPNGPMGWFLSLHQIVITISSIVIGIVMKLWKIKDYIYDKPR